MDLGVPGRTEHLERDFMGDAGWAKLWRLTNATINGGEEPEIGDLDRGI